MVVWNRNSSAIFIALIMKKQGVMELNDFCPIILLGARIGFLAKILVLRLERVMPSIISQSQRMLLRSSKSWLAHSS